MRASCHWWSIYHPDRWTPLYIVETALVMRGRGHRVKIFVLRTPFANICSKPIRFSPSGPQQNALHVASFSLTGGTNTDPPKVLRADWSITIWIDMSHLHHCMKSSVRLLSFTIRISMGVMIPVNQVCICGRHSGLLLLFSNGNYLHTVCLPWNKLLFL